MTVQEWVEAHFDRCAGWLQAALDREPVKTHTLEHVRAELDAGRAQIWPTENGVVVTEVITYPTGVKILAYWLAGGDLSEIIQTHANLEEFARLSGCDAIEIKGRRGWAPILRRLGFASPVGTHFVKVLENG